MVRAEGRIVAHNAGACLGRDLDWVHPGRHEPGGRVVGGVDIEALSVRPGSLDLEEAWGLAEKLRIAVARMIVAAAEASGEGLLGTGPKVSPQEKQIDSVLSLSDSATAAVILTVSTRINSSALSLKNLRKLAICS